MLFYLVTRAHRYTIDWFLETWGRDLVDRIRVICYEELPEGGTVQLPRGTYLFSDLERLGPKLMGRAQRVAFFLEEALGPGAVLNRPDRVMLRYELLRTLRERGINDFDVYRLDEVRVPRRWPVFLRPESDHGRGISELLPDAAALEAEIAARVRKGVSRRGQLVVEFEDVSDADGRFPKFGTFVVRGRALPRNHYLGTSFNVRYSTSIPYGDELRERERQYIAENPMARDLAEVAALAGVDYGRFDFSIKAGRPVIWELNTNPTIVVADRAYTDLQQLAIQNFLPAFRSELERLAAGTD